MQEFDVRLAVPFGFYNTALNLGISAGVVFPWGQGFKTKPSPLPERFYLGGDFSPVCTLGGPTTLWGFKTRGVGPTEPRRQRRDEENDGTHDFIGGDLSVTAFADLSFDLPIRWLRDQGIHAHIFAGSGNVAKLTQDEYKHFSPRKFLDSFRLSAGCGIVIPTRLFRLEANYVHLLRKDEYDRGKTGF
ncbi:sorting and assembly machinery component 50-like protein, partial [Trifolium medium]|nr:sorting and assembly machinery component 50-like protein [Trifolium medium]